jgi:hypothetical protein
MSLSKLGTCNDDIKKRLSKKIQSKTEESQKFNTWFEDLIELLSLDTYKEKICHLTVSGTTLKWLVLMKRSTSKMPDPSVVQLKICSDRSYSLQICNVVKEQGTFYDEVPHKNLPLNEALDYLTNEDYTLCPGIPDYDSFKNEIRFDSKHVRKWGTIQRVDSDKCLLWHKPQNRREAHKDMLIIV